MQNGRDITFLPFIVMQHALYLFLIQKCAKKEDKADDLRVWRRFFVYTFRN